nr:immunoglobulin light chain junction region [Macaca mulatta]
WLQGYSTPYSF